MRICILSCDRYSPLLPGCMFFIERYWGKERPWNIDIVVNSPKHRLDELPYNKVYVGNDLGLSSNLIVYLNQLQDDPVMVLLDDYYIDRPPDTGFLKAIVACMEAHPEIGYVNLRPWSTDPLGDGNVVRTYTEWSQMNLDNVGLECDKCPKGLGYYDVAAAEYLLSLQPGIWRRDFLKSLLRPGENGWQAEIEGTKRAKTKINNMWVFGTFFHPIPYCNISRYGIWRENPDGSTSRDWIIAEVGSDHWVYKELHATLSGRGLR